MGGADTSVRRSSGSWHQSQLPAPVIYHQHNAKGDASNFGVVSRGPPVRTAWVGSRSKCELDQWTDDDSVAFIRLTSIAVQGSIERKISFASSVG
jgi:hypothetical protein